LNLIKEKLNVREVSEKSREAMSSEVKAEIESKRQVI
jgi:hypothetical protein